MKKSVIGTILLIVACISGIGYISIFNNGSNILEGLRFVCYLGAGAGIGILIPFLICTMMAYKKIEE